MAPGPWQAVASVSFVLGKIRVQMSLWGLFCLVGYLAFLNLGLLSCEKYQIYGGKEEGEVNTKLCKNAPCDCKIQKEKILQRKSFNLAPIKINAKGHQVCNTRRLREVQLLAQAFENIMHQAVLSRYVDDVMARRYLQDFYLELRKNLNIKPVPLKVLFLPHL